jgi:transcriptional regulator with XRE-family HTH domain
MATSSTVQQARQDIADRLREIRLDAGLTARAVAVAARWHESKCSRIEHARTPPSDADIVAWCEICRAPELADDLIAASRAADSTWTQWRRLERPGVKRAQISVAPLWERTRVFRIYSPFLIPGPVQSASYIRALLRTLRDRRPNLVDDIEEAVEVRLARQRVTFEGDRQFTIVVEENVLFHRIGGADVLREQLEYLRSAMSLPTLRLGIVPFGADRTPVYPVEMFFMHDDVQVNVELVSGWLRVTQPSEIAMYSEAFRRLSEMAAYGPSARALIGRALSALYRD